MLFVKILEVLGHFCDIWVLQCVCCTIYQLRYHAAMQNTKSFHDIQGAFQYKNLEVLF